MSLQVDEHSEPPRHGEGPTLDRRELLVRHLNGDKNAFAELVQHYKGLVYTYLIRAGVPEATADDLFQEIFFLLHRNAARFDPAQSLKPWLLTIAVNSVRSHYRKEKVRIPSVSPVTEVSPVDPQTPATQQEAYETAEWLKGELAELPPDQREVMVLHCVRGLEQSEVAEILKMPVNTVKTHLRRARLALAQKLVARSTLGVRGGQSHE